MRSCGNKLTKQHLPILANKEEFEYVSVSVHLLQPETGQEFEYASGGIFGLLHVESVKLHSPSSMKSFHKTIPFAFENIYNLPEQLVFY